MRHRNVIGIDMILSLDAALPFGEMRDDQRTLFVEPVDFVGLRPDRRR